jgi:hypothetical protein
VTPRARVVRALAVVCALLSVAWFGTTVWLRRQLEPVELRLLADVQALLPQRMVRAPHVQPDPGWFGDEVPGALEALHEPLTPFFAGDGERPEAGKLRRAVTSGKAPYAELPKQWADAVDAGHTGLQTLLLATHLEKGGIPEGLGVLGSPRDPLQEAWPLLRAAGKLAALEVARLESEGAVPLAVVTCIDALAVSRELSASGAVVGRMVAVGWVRELFYPCARAIDRALPEAQGRAAAQLSLLRKAVPPFTELVRRDAIGAQLQLFGGVASEPTQVKLPVWVREQRFGAASPGVTVAPVLRLKLLHTWLVWLRGIDLVLAAGDDPQKVAAATAAAAKESAASWNELARAAGPPAWSRVLGTHRDGLRLLDLLEKIARAHEPETFAITLESPPEGEPADVSFSTRARAQPEEDHAAP